MATKRRTLRKNADKVCAVTGPKGGNAVLSVWPNGELSVGARGFQPYDLDQHVKDRGERRRVRKKLYRLGYRGIAAATIR